MSGFLGQGRTNSQPSYTSFQLQTSAYGLPVALVFGATRIGGNIVWYDNFTAKQVGKSGKGASSGGKSGSSGQYNYFVDLAICLGEGPIAGVGTVWVSQSGNSLANKMPGASLFDGALGQAAWTGFPANQSFGYSGLAYVADTQYALGNSAALPNLNFEVQGIAYGGAANGIDADPAVVVTELLTNTQWGSGFPSVHLDGLTNYQTWCKASGLWISPAYTQQASAASMLADIATYTYAEFVWSSGVLTLVPRGTVNVSGNGATWTAPAAPLFDLTDDDFLPNQGGGGASGSATDDPVIVTRKRLADQINDIKLEVLDRASLYAAVPVEYPDEALIALYGRRTNGSQQAHLFADVGAAHVAAQLLAQKEHVLNTYSFTVDARYAVLDPMDIVSLTDSYLGLDHQWVRITEITENDDGSFSILAEEYPTGTGAAAEYKLNQGNGYNPNLSADPGPINPPIVFEAPIQLCNSNGLEIWCAVSGSNPAWWGGCNVWASTDGSTYKQVTTINGAARMGVLTATLASGSDPDTANTLSVDVSQSQAQLYSGTNANADSGDTVCYVDGEYLSYSAVTLVSAFHYSMAGYLRRGQYGSAIASHSSGSAFARLDNAIARIPISQPRVGEAIHLKFQSFNIYGGGDEDISSLTAYTHTITGAPNNFEPSGISAKAGLTTVALAWTNPPDTLYSVASVEVWRATTTGTTPPGGAVHVGDVSYPGSTYTDGGLTTGTTYYYWLRCKDPAGNFGPYSAPVFCTPNQVQTGDLGNGVITPEKFVIGLSPIYSVASLPNPAGYAGPPIVFLETDGQLYRYVGGAWTAAVPAVNVSGGITADQIAPNAVTSAQLAINQLIGAATGANPTGAGAIGALATAAGAVSTATIAQGAVTAAALANGSVTVAAIDTGAVTATALAAGAVTGPAIASSAVTAAKIAAGTITSGNIAANTITSGNIAANTITGGNIAANTIASGNIAAGAIQTANLAAGSVTTAALAAGAVTASTIAANTITSAQIAAGTITATQIAAGTITATQIAAGAISATMIAAGTFTGSTFQTNAGSGQRVVISASANDLVINGSLPLSTLVHLGYGATQQAAFFSTDPGWGAGAAAVFCQAGSGRYGLVCNGQAQFWGFSASFTNAGSALAIPSDAAVQASGSGTTVHGFRGAGGGSGGSGLVGVSSGSGGHAFWAEVGGYAAPTDIVFKSGGSGVVQLPNAYASGAPSATGYITVKDSSGTAYKVLVST